MVFLLPLLHKARRNWGQGYTKGCMLYAFTILIYFDVVTNSIHPHHNYTNTLRLLI